MNQIAQSIQDLPSHGWVPAMVLIVIGLALWAAGRRLLRPAFGALGLLFGGLAGWVLGETIDLGVPPWMVAVLGGLLAACVAVLAYRAAVAASLAAILGVAAPAALWAIVDPEGLVTAAAGQVPAGETEEAEPLLEPDPASDALDAWLADLIGEPPADSDPGGGESAESGGIADDLDEHIAEARTLAAHLARRGRELWSSSPPELRRELVGAAIIGALIGLIAGTLASTISASVVTAFGGAAFWITGGWSALTILGLSDSSVVPDSAGTAVLVWLVGSVIGLLIQWTLGPKRADKAA